MIPLVCPVHRTILSSDLECPAGHRYTFVNGIPDFVGTPNVPDLLERVAPFYESLWAPLGMLVTARRTYSSILKEAGSFTKADTYLDIGTGTGKIFDYVPCSDCVGLDLSLRFLEILKSKRSKVRVIRGDATSLPFPSESFQGVNSMLVLHMLNEPAVGISEISRVLVKGGRCSVGVLVEGGFLSSFLSSWWKLRPRTQEYYEKALEGHGLKVVHMERIGPWAFIKCEKL